MQTMVFGYSYSTGFGKNRRTTRQSVVLIESETLNLPPFDMRPEHLLHKIGGAFGYQDIDFPGQERFSKKYLLRGRDEAAIRSLFTDEVLAYFTSNLDLSVEGRRGALIGYKGGKRMSPDGFRQVISQANRISKLFVGSPC